MIADTIRNQLGNLAFIMMGASQLVGLPNGLQFKIGANAKRVNRIRVTLGPTDTYTVTFEKVASHGLDVKKLAEVDEVYFDQLKQVIEANTGLYLSL